MLKKLLVHALSPFYLIKDLILFKLFKKKASEKTHNFFIILFCLSGGLSNRILDFLLSSPKKLFKSSSIYLKNFDKKLALENLNQLGFFFKENVLSHKDVQEIQSFLKNVSGIYRSDEYFSKEKEKFNFNSPKAVTFHYDQNDLIENHLIQKIAIDRNIVNLVGDYFKKSPVLDAINMWWSLPSNKPDMTSAQAWHFDLDRTKWLKVFIYLTDCGEKNGPHYFIQKSHNDNGIPFGIRKKGYERIDQETINHFYKKEDIKHLTAKQGAVLFEDTRGMHKGQKVEVGSRLILILQYTTNLFGHLDTNIKFPKNTCQEFLDCKKNNPFFFSNFKTD